MTTLTATRAATLAPAATVPPDGQAAAAALAVNDPHTVLQLPDPPER